MRPDPPPYACRTALVMASDAASRTASTCRGVAPTCAAKSASCVRPWATDPGVLSYVSFRFRAAVRIWGLVPTRPADYARPPAASDLGPATTQLDGA